MVLENPCGEARALCVDSGRSVTRQASGCTNQEAEAELLPVFSQRKPHLCKLCAYLSFIFAVSLTRSHKAGRLLMGSRCLKSKYAQGRGRCTTRAGSKSWLGAGVRYTGTLPQAWPSVAFHGRYKQTRTPTV